MKIAVVHDYFTQIGGAEQVAAALMHILPGAALHATVALPECVPASLAGVPVTTSWMQKLPGMRDYYRFYFLLYPLAVPSQDLSSYELVLSSSSGYARYLVMSCCKDIASEDGGFGADTPSPSTIAALAGGSSL